MVWEVVWVCVRCETKNEDAGMYCAVCGMKREVEAQLPKEKRPVIPPVSVEARISSAKDIDPAMPVSYVKDESIPVSEKNGNKHKELIGWIVLFVVFVVLGLSSFSDFSFSQFGFTFGTTENYLNLPMECVSISAGEYHTVGLKSDGTVLAVGDNEYGQCKVFDWKNIKIPN